MKYFLVSPSTHAPDVIEREQGLMQMYIKMMYGADAQFLSCHVKPDPNARRGALIAMASAFQRLADCDRAVFDFGWEEDPFCKMLMNSCVENKIPYVKHVLCEF